MRRKDREIKNIREIFEVVERCKTVRLAMIDGGRPYAVTMNFGYERDGDRLILYFHSAKEGRKIMALRSNPIAYFIIDDSIGIAGGDGVNPCAFSWNYASVTGEGEIEFIEDNGEKSRALNLIISQARGQSSDFSFPISSLENTCVMRLICDNFVGKRRE